jgi:Fe2+ or Zn2+ uptake regulation protein
MDLTDIPDDLRDSGEAPPDFDELEDPRALLKGGPVRERLYDVILQLREPTKVSTVAERADCDTETARDYLRWFAEMGMVHEHTGRPVRYERNESYFRWRRVNRIREQYTDEEIVERLAAVVKGIEAYRERFDADTPDEVSLVAASRTIPTEEAWEALSEWRTLERRAELLDAARRTDAGPGGASEPVDV